MNYVSQVRRAIAMGALAVCLAFGVAACGSSSSDDGSDSSSTTASGGDAGAGARKVRVAMNPLAGYTPILVGIDQGFFEDEGIDVEAELTTESSSALIPLAVRDEYQLVTGLAFNFVSAFNEGIEFEAVSAISPLAGIRVDALLVDGDKIRSAQDLEGQAVCTSRLGSAQEFYVRAWMESEGADSSTIRPVAIPFPAQVSAVRSGRCAVTATETPFVERGVQEGLTALSAYNEIGGGASSLGGHVFGTREWVEGNGDTARAFAAGLERAAQYSNEHPEAVREALVRTAGLTQEQADATPIPEYATGVDVPGGQETADVMNQLGFLRERVPFEEMVWSGAPRVGGQ